MNLQEKEIEVKFLVRSLDTLHHRLEQFGARLVQPRTLEINLRFDTPQGDLASGQRVLRLRRDITNRLTYKGPSSFAGNVTNRQEIEFEVSDFDKAHHFLEALGYQVSTTYEKYRTAYQIENVEFALDEMPYGNFVEIEGEDADAIYTWAKKAGLDWDARVLHSYLQIFAELNDRCGLTYENLTFADFNGYRFSAKALGIAFADRPAD